MTFGNLSPRHLSQLQVDWYFMTSRKLLNQLGSSLQVLLVRINLKSGAKKMVMDGSYHRPKSTNCIKLHQIASNYYNDLRWIVLCRLRTKNCPFPGSSAYPVLWLSIRWSLALGLLICCAKNAPANPVTLTERPWGDKLVSQCDVAQIVYCITFKWSPVLYNMYTLLS